MANRLAQETSPYLLQHKDNPVDWRPWDSEALARAVELDRPLLVSIGYAACHWCHVMEHESFEDPQIAALMNERFVPVKVDREEHPEVDAACMEACQRMTGHGGWPLNAFLTPGLEPFYAGTYYPPEPRQGMPSWRMVLDAIADAWTQRREQVVGQAAEVARAIGASARIEPSNSPLTTEHLIQAQAALSRRFDAANGGWGRAPKFPQSSTIELLLARGEREMSLATLRAMAAGGIYDQLAGGFSRYAVDATWTVPHFEKMLYDNALLARAYLHGWLVSGEERMREVCCETLDWALAEMRGPEGGFYSSLDADSEGVEGRFYVWTAAELRAALADPKLGQAAVAYFGATEQGNFEHGSNVLEARGPAPSELPEIRATLLRKRAERVRPGLDDKRLASWNALMIAALAEAGAVLERGEYLDAASACADFVLREMSDGPGRLLRTWKDGRARLAAPLEDHAFMLDALLILYEATFDERWYREASTIADSLIERFADPRRGGFFTTAEDHTDLIARRKDLDDSPIPSGNSAASLALLRLARLSGDSRYEHHAVSVLRLLVPLADQHPGGFSHLERALDFYLAPVREVAIVGGDADGAGRLARAVRERFRPHLVLAGTAAPIANGSVPLLEGRGLVEGRAAAYVCERFACQAPVTDVESLEALL